MIPAAPFEIYMLLSTLLHTILQPFALHFSLSEPWKLSFSFEKVVIFQLFSIFASEVFCELFAADFRFFAGASGTLLAAVWGLPERF